MSISAHPSIPNDVVTTRWRFANRRSVQATISSGVDSSAISTTVGVSCVSILLSLSEPENEKARRTLPAGFTPMRVNFEPSGRPVGWGVPHTTTRHGLLEGSHGAHGPAPYGGAYNHTVRLAHAGRLVNMCEFRRYLAVSAAVVSTAADGSAAPVESGIVIVAESVVALMVESVAVVAGAAAVVVSVAWPAESVAETSGDGAPAAGSGLEQAA